MSELVQFETLILELLLVVSIVAIIVRRFRIPYTVALVLAGLALSFRVGIQIELTSELILALLLPPLVFEAAFHLDLDHLKRSIVVIATLAIPGVVLNMLIVGGILSLGPGVPLSIALVFGALIAATDPVSVVAIFRRLGAPKQLEVLLEGESLFNDGTAIVIFGLALEIVGTGDLDLMVSIGDFIRVAAGGLLIGATLGWLFSLLASRVDDYLIEITLTTVLAFGAYILAEQFHLSGVLAVVAAGLVSGNLGEREMSPTTRIVLVNFWEYLAFLANSAVFLLIGVDIEIGSMLSNWTLILWAIGAVLVSRAITIYSLTQIDRTIPNRWRHVLFWGGLRGAIALALALSIPNDFGPERRTLIEMTYGVVLFSLVVQGMSMNTLLKRLKITIKTEDEIEYERRNARAMAARAGLHHLQGLSQDGLISAHTWHKIEPMLEQRMDALVGSVQEVIRGSPELEAEEIENVRREMLRAQRSMLGSMRASGSISQETFEELVAEIDQVLTSDRQAWGQYVLRSTEYEEDDICQLLLAVVQSRDLESASNALAIRGIRVTRIQSRGGFLRKRNHVLLMGIAEGRLEDALETFERVCQERVEYISPLDLGGEQDDAVPVQLKGAVAFVFDVEQCEVLT
ncbi:MAG: Na+/H+ antiporter [Anaerolineales bacterium]|nr:Na+/H+ antiporter [Anaerolineales bacterium]